MRSHSDLYASISVVSFVWKLLCAALGKQDWLADARFATNKDRVANRAILEPLIEAFFLGSMVASFSFWIDLPEAQEEFVRKVPFIAQEYAAKFNRDERFWFTA